MEASLTSSLHTPSAPRSRSHSPAPSFRRMQTEDSEKAGRVWARDPDDDPWAPCILTLDGGGIRGYSSLLILKELMHHIWLWEQKLDQEEQQQDAHRPDSPRAAGTDAPPEGSSPVVAGFSSEDGSVADTEGRYGVDTNIQAPSVDPAHSHVHHDRLTAGFTKAEALSEEELLPCHYFDFMYGTSTGGLIATILGRLRMSVTEALDLYREVGETLFGKKRSSIPLTTKYDHKPLEDAVRDIVRSRCKVHADCDGNDVYPWEVYQGCGPDDPFDVDKPRVCQSCCLAASNDEHISEAYLLRSYPHYYSADCPNWITLYNEGADMLPIWQVTRATTAAPFYFEMVKATVNDVQRSFKDGGIRQNNPSGTAFSEFHALYAGRCDHPCLMLSVGTGRPDQSVDGFANTPGPLSRIPFISKFLEKRAIIQNLLIKFTEGEHEHVHMREHAQGEHTWYKRLNVSEGLQHMALDDWVKGEWHGKSNVPGGASLKRMEDATAEYLDREFDYAIDSYAPPSVMLRQAAEKLVRQRRARERLGGERWDVFLGRQLDQVVG